MRKGVLLAVCCYLTWGLFPLYFKTLANIAPLEILSHRIVWALPFVLLILACRAQWFWLGTILSRPKVLAGFMVSALLLATNWFTYIWAVNHGRVVDASLGYFINPIVNVLLGYLLLSERLRLAQWLAVACAGVGVLWLAILNGHMPWISLILALSFGAYGLLRKTAALGALEGLALETMILFPCALGWLLYLQSQGQSALHWNSNGDTNLTWLLMAAGPITAIPLLCFASAARQIPMATLGILQYISPSIQLLLGVWLYHESFSSARLIGFMIIWGGLLLYSAEGLWRGFQLRQLATERTRDA